ncbi:MAG: hypothetical protein IJE72_00535 [Clostridia bacterium]|nr:hypothetical protein [Clostridia bacterium]
MKQSSKCALGGIVAALSLVMMISVAVIPFLTYALPAAAGMLIIFMVIETDRKWAFGVYCTVAILGMLLVPDKEVAVMYLAFFGYYPIIKAVFESKLNTAVGWIIKVLTFVATMVASYAFMMKFMGVTIDETEEFGSVAIPILLGTGTLAFILYDIALTKMITLYMMRWQKHFKRYFK